MVQVDWGSEAAVANLENFVAPALGTLLVLNLTGFSQKGGLRENDLGSNWEVAAAEPGAVQELV